MLMVMFICSEHPQRWIMTDLLRHRVIHTLITYSNKEVREHTELKTQV